MATYDDETRFAAYFEGRYRTVRRTAYLLCGDWHWADDLAQTAFVRVASSWHRVRDPAALDAYTRTCLVRAYLAESRRMWRRRERPYADPPDSPAAGDDAEVVSRRQAFAGVLRQLPPRQRAVVVLRYYQGLDVAAVAAALGCTEGTVKSQTARGLAKLRRLLDVTTPEEVSL